MKDKNISKNNNSSNMEREKTSYEKFEEEVKSAIFNVLYVLLKDDEHSHWKHIVLILFDFFQIYFFSFAESLHFPWKSNSVLGYVQTFLNFFQINYWLAKLDTTTYLVFFYICIFVICMVIIDIFYVSYSFSKKKFSFVWPLQVLRSVCGLFVTVLFLPLLETFSSMIHCHFHDGHQINTIFPSMICWSGMHIIHATFSIVVSFIFIIICIIVSLTYFDSQSTSHDITAKVNSRAETFVITLKIVITYLWVFLGEPKYQWLHIACLLILSFTSYCNFRYHWPFFNDKMTKFFCVLTGMFLWANFCLFIAKVLENTHFNGALQLYFLGLPLVVGLIIFDKDERVELLLKNINNFQSGEAVALQIRYLLNLITTKEHNRKNAIILKGYIYHHEDSCPNQDCQLKQYKNGLIQNSKIKKSTKKHTQISQNYDNQQLLLQHVKNMYKQGIQKFPICTPLKIQYAFFLMERLNKKQEAITELLQAEQFNPPFDEQFIIYRYKKMSEDFGDNANDSHAGGMDVVARFAYESSLRQFQEHIEKSAQLHYDFWNCLREDRPDIAKLNQCGSKINQSIIMVEQYWSQLQKLNSNSPKALKLYAKFLIEILNDKEGGQELLSRAKDATNVKQNYYDANNMNEDLNDINSMSANGTPCIYVTGDSDKIGMITQCNSGSCRIFGYTAGEMKNHNVEKLMPEMYAKNHSKILDDALAKGPENIPNKERLVFARHKSGYVFPVWLQLKMVQNSQAGISFVALFKIDKKIMSSNIAYVLLNKEKKIQGISSSCMKIMNLDIQKMRRLSTSGIDINKLAPSLFANDGEFNYSQKAGATLEWHLPDFDRTKKQQSSNISRSVNKWSDSAATSRIGGRELDVRKIGISEQKLNLSCHLNTIVMGDLGEIGWYLKLENNINNKSIQNLQRKDKDRERIRQPLFQFRYDGQTGRFIRELKENPYIDNATKNPNFINGRWLTQLIEDSETKGNNLNPLKGDVDKQEIDPEDVKIVVEDKQQHTTPQKLEQDMDVFERKRYWGRGIQMYKLVGGKFFPKDYDEDIKKQQQIEEEQRKKNEDEDKSQNNADAFKNNIKSRKALQMAINDKSTPKAIRHLRITMNLVIITLMALAITEFSVINSQFNDINDNFNLIQKSYGRISEVQRIAYNVRSIILINEKKQTVYQNYTTQSDYITFLKQDIEDALNNLYDLQNTISLSSLSMSDQQQQLVDTKNVNLYFKDQGNSLKTLSFSLTESVLQIASAIFTARHLNTQDFKDTQEDVHFITYNCYNDFLVALRKSSLYYVKDLHSRTDQKTQLILTLFLASVGCMLVSLTILLPVISNVNFARMKVLSLFVDIPNHHVFALGFKCENFISSFHEDHNDEIESDDGDNNKNEELEMMMQGQNKRGGHKMPKNSTRSNQKFFIQAASATLITTAYFLAMFILSQQYIDNIKIITEEMNTLAQAESYYSFSQNTIREMLYNPNKPILNHNSYQVARDSIEQLYRLNQFILDDHFNNRDILGDDYKNMFSDVYKKDICKNPHDIKLSLISQQCETFLSGAATHGLQTVLMRYFESLKDLLKTYVLYQEKGYQVQNLYNQNTFLELYVIQFRFIQDSFRQFVDTLKNSVNNDFQSRIDTRMAAFIVFIIGILIGYLIIWTPFVNKLNNEIWRTKAMLTIIPIEVILKIPRIQEFLHSQTFFTNKSSTQGSSTNNNNNNSSSSGSATSSS